MADVTDGKDTPNPAETTTIEPGATALTGTVKPATEAKAGAVDDTKTTPAGEKKEPEGTAAAAEAAKAPEKYDLKLPENAPFAASDLPTFEAEAKALGLSQAQAQKLVDHRIAHVENVKTTLYTELQADKELGGAKLEESVALAVRGRDLMFPPNSEGAKLVAAIFEETGYGNHKELLRGFARIGRMLSEDTQTGKPAGGADTKPKTLAATLYDKTPAST